MLRTEKTNSRLNFILYHVFKMADNKNQSKGRWSHNACHSSIVTYNDSGYNYPILK